MAQVYAPTPAYPPPLANPPPQGYTPQRLIPADADGEQLYDAQGRPLPPGTVFRQAPPGYREVAPSYRGPQQGYPSQAPQGYETALPSAPAEQEATRPPLPLGPAQTQQSTTSADPPYMAAFPPEVRPETGPKKTLPPQFRRTLVDYYTKEPAGTIIVDNRIPTSISCSARARRCGTASAWDARASLGRAPSGSTKIAEWPDWNPPEEMIVRRPYLPRFMAGGETNPLGARALYLGKTVYRIHGTNQPSTIGTFVSSGCIRLTNEDVMDLYSRVKVGTRVVVLAGKPPPTAAATPPAPAAAVAPSGIGPAVMTSPLTPPPSAMAR